MINSAIQWTDHTWNVAVGCTKVDDDCKFCYMYRDSLNETRYNPKVVRKTKTVFNLPKRIKEPSKIFTSSLTDFFHEDIDAFRDEAWDIIRACPQHTFQILTKRPERAFIPEDIKNVWLGTSIGSERSMYRVFDLLKAKAPKRFISFEPLHGEIMSNIPMIGIDWIIIGGESGNETGKYRYRPCELHWIQYLAENARYFNIPVFVKQLGTHLAKQMNLKHRHGGDINEWPEHLRIRQFPI